MRKRRQDSGMNSRMSRGASCRTFYLPFHDSVAHPLYAALGSMDLEAEGDLALYHPILNRAVPGGERGAAGSAECGRGGHALGGPGLGPTLSDRVGVLLPLP